MMTTGCGARKFFGTVFALQALFLSLFILCTGKVYVWHSRASRARCRTQLFVEGRWSNQIHNPSTPTLSRTSESHILPPKPLLFPPLALLNPYSPTVLYAPPIRPLTCKNLIVSRSLAFWFDQCLRHARLTWWSLDLYDRAEQWNVPCFYAIFHIQGKTCKFNKIIQKTEVVLNRPKKLAYA